MKKRMLVIAAVLICISLATVFIVTSQRGNSIPKPPTVKENLIVVEENEDITAAEAENTEDPVESEVLEAVEPEIEPDSIKPKDITTPPPVSYTPESPQVDPPVPEPVQPPSPPAPAFDSGMVISSVTTQVGGFMTTVPTDELGYMGYQINASFSQDKIISELVDAFRSLNSRYGNTYFNITYLGASGGYHQFQLYYG